jgi:c-di-GMP-binding flagellar brake protein YcgR
LIEQAVFSAGPLPPPVGRSRRATRRVPTGASIRRGSARPDEEFAEIEIETDKSPAVHDQVLVEVELGGKVVGLRAVVVNVMPTTLWLGMVAPDSDLEKIRPDQPLVLTIKREGAAIVAASTFLSHLGASRSRLFSVEWPNDLHLVQRRAHLRLDAQCPVEYTVSSQSETGSAGLAGSGTTRNISAGGIQFVVKPGEATIDVGDEIELEVGLGSDAVEAGAAVIRVETIVEGRDGRPKPKGAPKGPVTLVAVHFVSISEIGQDKIVRHIFSLQRTRRDAVRKPS